MSRDSLAYVWLAMLLCGMLIGLAPAAPPATAVAVSHRHTQARTDSQPVLKDDLANQKRDTGNLPVIPNSSPDLGAVVGSAIEAARPSQRDVWTYGAAWCGWCTRMAREMPNAPQDGIKWNYTHDPLPEWVEALLPQDQPNGLPVTVLWDTRVSGTNRVVARRGYMSPQQLAELVNANRPALVPQAVSVGTIKVRSQVDAFLSLVKPGRNGPEIVVGSARILMPSKAEVTEEISPETYKRVYTGTKPVYVYGILSVPVSEMTMSRNKLRLIAGGWPVELTVE